MSGRVGLVGIGVMGSAIGRNLCQAGFEVHGFDPVPDAMKRLEAFGGIPAGSPGAVAETCSAIILSLPSPDALSDAVDGPAGLAQVAVDGTVLVECSTLPLDAKHRAREALAKTGKILLDCPLSGTGAQAANKDLVVLGSGDETAFDKVRPVLEGFSRVQRYLGPFGHGSIMKYVANHLVTIHNVAAAEAMVLGIKAGLDPALLYDTLADSAATSRMFQVRGPMMRDARYDEVTATIKTHLKDLSIINAFAAGIDCPVPLFAAAMQPYYAGAAQGRALQDTAAVCAVLEQMAGVKRD